MNPHTCNTCHISQYRSNSGTKVIPLVLSQVDIVLLTPVVVASTLHLLSALFANIVPSYQRNFRIQSGDFLF